MRPSRWPGQKFFLITPSTKKLSAENKRYVVGGSERPRGLAASETRRVMPSSPDALMALAAACKTSCVNQPVDHQQWTAPSAKTGATIANATDDPYPLAYVLLCVKT